MSTINLQEINTNSLTASIDGSSVDNGTLTASLKEKTAAISLDTLASEAATAVASMNNTAKLKKQYASASGGRLVEFEYTDGTDDSQRRAYFQIIGDTSSLASDVGSDTAMVAVLNALKDAGGFSGFVLMGITENHQEKQSIMTTINDYFVATFSGHEPQILTINGMLPFDANMAESSWFIKYLNAYTYLFRASVLAKYKLQLKLILPDFSSYICYPISFTAGLQATQDNLVQFQMSALVAQEAIKKATGVTEGAKASSNTAEKVKETAKKETSKQDSSDTNTPKDVGKNSSDKSFIETTTKVINLLGATSAGLNAANKIFSSNFTQTTGAINTAIGTAMGVAYGVRSVLKV